MITTRFISTATGVMVQSRVISTGGSFVVTGMLSVREISKTSGRGYKSTMWLLLLLGDLAPPICCVVGVGVEA